MTNLKLNFERIKRKILSLNLSSIVFFTLSIITATFAWFAYNKIVNNNIDLDIIDWKINLTENSLLTNDISVDIDDFAPGNEMISKTVNISNVGNVSADISYNITYLRIFDVEYDVSDQTALYDLLAQSYPFTINFSIGKDTIGPNENTNFTYSIEWPYESGNDLLDSQWYNNAYTFNQEEQALHDADSDYEIRNCIEINAQLKASQNALFVSNSHEIGETKLFDITDNSECSTASSTCLSHYLVKVYDNNLLYMVNPSLISSSITANNISSQTNDTLSLYNFFELIKMDIIDSDIVTSNLSNRIFGNSSVSTYDELKSKIITKNSNIIFKSSVFNYLNSNTCYWINEKYDETHTFAVKNLDSTYIELYPELNTNSCKYLNFINYKIDSTKVIFKANGGTISLGEDWSGSGSVAYKNVILNNSYGLLPSVTRNHFTFEGWYDINGNKLSSSSIYENDSESIYYAHWTPNTMTVTYNANGGSVITSSGTQTYYSNYVNLPYPTKLGYSFSGWYTASSGGTLVTTDTIVSNINSHTLYAHYTSLNANSLYYKVSSQASSDTVNFSIRSGATPVTNGVYTTTSTEGNVPVYYYRGNVNNHVIFNNMCWRIVRTTETGGVKLIYNGTPTNGTCVATGSSTLIGTSAFNTNYDDNAYVGYMYGTAGSSTYESTHTNTNSSTIKTAIDNWYSSNFTSSSVTSKIEDTIYCNDRSMVSYDSTKISDSSLSSYTILGYGTNATLYSAVNRASYWTITPSPTLVCSQANDKFTVSSSNGNGALTYPAGLITLDEAVLAGFNSYASNTGDYLDDNNYLYSGSGFSYWSLSPIGFDSDNGDRAYVGSIGSTGYLRHDYAGSLRYVRPVISLASGVTVTGSGTSTSPYVVDSD